MNVIEIAEPTVCEHEVSFSWTVEPTTALYDRTAFSLRFPASVDLAAVPQPLWWRIALMCLHAHWPLLRPCRVLLPGRLPESEVEFWLRLTDAAVATLEARAGRTDTERRIEIVGSGRPLAPAQRAHHDRHAGVISCFSSGRDSITQASMLSELGEDPTLVTVTSPVAWSIEHDAPRRREVLAEITRRRPFELVEVVSDLRGNCRNTFAGGRYDVGVNELTDSFLYLAAAIVVGAAREARLVLMASEAEVQENAKLGGMVIQARHFMYSAATQLALGELLAPTGIGVASLTHSLRQFQVQRLLSERYADLRDLQYSCWELASDEAACSRCLECRGIALNLISRQISPASAGIDLVKFLLAHVDWQPGTEYLQHDNGNADPPSVTVGRAKEMQELRCLTATSAEQVARLIDGAHPVAERERALEIYRRLREQALAREIEPEPGYGAGYLELLDGNLRDGLRAILDEHFTPAPPDSYARRLANTRLLADWISAPLRRARAVTVPGDELESVRTLIPDPEPELTHPAEGRLVPVAETLLDGNELDYVRECVTGNWISSAGSFVPRFERAFADAVGCRYGVACSSGTAALHLALVATGIGSGDEVILPAFTMIATANAVRYVGGDPILVDADPHTWNLNPERLIDKLSSRTRALIAVHTYGQPAEMDAIRDFADRNGLVVIEDAAEAHGSLYRGRPVGSIGDVAAFSFYGNKILTTGEGGIVTTNDERIAEIVRELRGHAFSRERHFWHRRRGFSYRMTNLQAAIGLAQTERLGELVARHRENARRYREALHPIEGLGLPPDLEGGVTWMFGVTVGEQFGCDRDELRRRLAARGVETRTFFVPMHVQPIYFERFAGQRYPVAEELGRSGLYLPSGPDLADDDIAYITDAVRASAGDVAAERPSSA